MRTSTFDEKYQWLTRRQFVAQRINEINDWRNEAMKYALTTQDRERINARVLYLREKLERNK